jgi:hypothetical protein
MAEPSTGPSLMPITAKSCDGELALDAAQMKYGFKKEE